MEKKINNKKIVKYVGMALISGALTAGIAIGAYESSVNHEIEYCHLCDVIGLQHQANAINNGVNNFRFYATYEEGTEVKNEGFIDNYTYGHTINYAYSTVAVEDSEEYDGFDKLKLDDLEQGFGYSLNDLGFLTNKRYLGERVDMYDDSCDGYVLIRTFKK